MKVGELINKSAKFLNTFEAFDKVRELRRNGIPNGLTSGWKKFDEYFTFPPMGNLNVVTGFPGSGKSEWINSLAINVSAIHNWKVFVYAPEDYPAEFHLQKLCEKATGKAFFGNYGGEPNCTEDDINRFEKHINSNFTFIDCHINSATIDEILNSIFLSCINKKVDMAIIDPWNKLSSQKPANMSNTDFIGQCLTRIQMFARQNYISFWIVAHPAKPVKLSSGKIPSLSLYDISDSSHWYNMIDNGFIIHRNWEDKAGNSYKTDIRIAKIKDRRYGKCGDHSMEFEPATGHFKEFKQGTS